MQVDETDIGKLDHFLLLMGLGWTIAVKNSALKDFKKRSVRQKYSIRMP